MAVGLERLTEIEHQVARERFRSRVLRLAVVSIVFDLVVGALAWRLEQGAPHEFETYWAALFWTTTQLLTVSSQLPNPEHPATKVLDVLLEAYAIVVITSLAATFSDLLHHRTRRRMRQRFKAEAEAEGG